MSSRVDAQPLVEVEHLTKHFAVKQGVFARGHGVVHAVEDVTLTVFRGETLGIGRLDDVTQVHDHDAIADLPDHR